MGRDAFDRIHPSTCARSCFRYSAPPRSGKVATLITNLRIHVLDLQRLAPERS
jgi:hypothetical protein